MCIPNGKSRNKQKVTQKKVSSNKTAKVMVENCDLGKEKEKPVSKLIRLEVAGATSLGGDRYWALRDDQSKVRVKAVTDPNDKSAWSQVTWVGGSATNSPIVVEVDLKNVADVPVKASLDCEKSVTIEIYDLVSLDCPLPTNLGAQKWKSYQSDKTTRMKATTNPNLKKVWDLLVWSEGTPAASNESDVDLKPVGDRTVTVSLSNKKLSADLHICQWPRLKIKEVTFDCHKVLNDGVKEIDVPFDKKWKAGRANSAKNQKAADSQSPICFTRGNKIKLSAEFEVTQKATDDETVSVKGDLGFGEVKADVAVKAGADKATMALTTSTAALPAVVDCDDAWGIKWCSVLEDATSWADADSSTHLLYVLLGDPLKAIYFTMLDISCRGAKGKSTEGDFVEKSFEPYKSHIGDNKGFQRKGDGKRLSYYKKGHKTAADNTTYTPKGMLSSAESTGRCGGWVEFLRHMWAIHGVTSGRRWYVRAAHPDHVDMNLRFLVKSLTFKVVSLGGPYTHNGEPAKKEVTKENGIPGQGKTNPQFDFGDHVVAIHDGKIFDPSYGVGPYSSDKDYLKGALDGLGQKPTYKFDMADKTPQFISRDCVPYSKGFAEYVIQPDETLDDIAKKYISTAQVLLDLDKALKAKRLTTDKVVAGDTVVVPTKTGKRTHVLQSSKVTFDIIAKAHGLTKQVIFDAADNDALKKKRKTIDKVVAGDKIIISCKLQPDGAWVIGHDL